MEESARLLFSSMDDEVERTSGSLCNQILAQVRDIPNLPHLRTALEPVIRDELDRLVQGLLGVLNNVGGALPDSAPTYAIIATAEGQSADIAVDGTDYADLWYEYLLAKAEMP